MKFPETSMRRCITLCAFFVLAIAAPVAAQEIGRESEQIIGTVIDADTRATIAGALIHIRQPSQRIYTANDGTFRLSAPTTRYDVRISSLGYKRLDTTITSGVMSIVFALTPSSVQFPNVEVTASLDGNIIIQRAIKRKEENNYRLST